MSNHPELYVEAFVNKGEKDPYIMIGCQCGYQEWYEGYKYTILDLEEYTQKFKNHWQTDCLKTNGAAYV